MPRRLAYGVVGILLGVFVIVPVIDRGDPYERFNGRIIPNTPSRGQEVTIEFDAKIWKRCPGKATRHVIDGNGADHDYKPHEAFIYDLPQADPVLRVKFVLPSTNDKSIEKDWEYYVDLEYYCNWTQRYIYPIKSRTPSIWFRPT